MSDILLVGTLGNVVRSVGKNEQRFHLPCHMSREGYHSVEIVIKPMVA